MRHHEEVIRQARPEDFELIRAVRLSALADSPTAFGSTYERELAFTEQDWRNRLGPGGNPTFVWEADGEAHGMVGAAVDARDPDVVDLVAMWVKPERRGAGVADALVRAVISWARDSGASTVRLTVTAGNGRAERVYKRHGFGFTGRVIQRERDGLSEVEMDRATIA